MPKFFSLLISLLLFSACYTGSYTRHNDAPRYQIMGQGLCSQDDLANFLVEGNNSVVYNKAYEMVDYYISESNMEGVNYEVAFVQMCLETGYLRFNGTVRPEQNNFCGLGTVDNNTQGAYFSTIREGVRAHIQHLKAYASTESLRNAQVDPRFQYVTRGSAQTVDQLTGKWATNPDYGALLMKMLDEICPASSRDYNEFR